VWNPTPSNLQRRFGAKKQLQCFISTFYLALLPGDSVCFALSEHYSAMDLLQESEEKGDIAVLSCPSHLTSLGLWEQNSHGTVCNQDSNNTK
jgi:hypothetical protein